MARRMKTLSTFLLSALLSTAASGTAAQPRWYKPAHTELGRGLFDTHCASCHGKEAIGDPNWRQPDENGLYRPPPLNGTAHAWHHPLAVLYQQIMKGSAPGAGNMPAFQNVLDRGEALAIISYFQSLWSDEIYGAWQRMDEAGRK